MSRSRSSDLCILCVEDEAELREDMASELVEAGYRIVEAPDGAAALTKLQSHKFALIISDMRLPHISGMELLEQFRAKIDPDCRTPFIFTTAFCDAQTQAAALASGAVRVLVKPIDYVELLEVVHDLLASH